MDSAKVTEETFPEKTIDDANQLKKAEVSENATLNKEAPNAEEIKSVRPKRMAKTTSQKSKRNGEEVKREEVAKTIKSPDVAEIVLDSLKSLKMRKGAPIEAICQHIAGKHTIDDAKHLKKAEVSENATLNKKAPNAEAMKSVRLKRMAKTTGEKNKKNGEETKREEVVKTIKSPDVAEMVLDSFKSLKMRKGAPIEAIRQHIAVKYNIDMKKLKPGVQRFLKNSLDKGFIEEDAAGRFKVKRKDFFKMETQNKKVKADTKSFPEQKKTNQGMRNNRKGN